MSRSSCHVVVVGDARVGKTSLISRYVDRSFPDKPQDVAEEYRERLVELEEGRIVTLRLWECPSNGDFHPAQQRRIEGIVVVFDMTDHVSWDNVSQYLRVADRSFLDITSLPLATKPICDRRSTLRWWPTLLYGIRCNLWRHLQRKVRMLRNCSLLLFGGA